MARSLRCATVSSDPGVRLRSIGGWSVSGDAWRRRRRVALLAIAALGSGATLAPAATARPLVVVDVNGPGKVRIAPLGRVCVDRCAFRVDAGTRLTVVPLPEAGASLDGYTGVCRRLPDGRCRLRVRAGRRLSVHFSATVALSFATKGAGVVRGPGGLSCPIVCLARVPSGSPFDLVAEAAPGWHLESWGANCPAAATCTLSLDSDASLSATFVRDADPIGSGAPVGDAPPVVTGSLAVGPGVETSNGAWRGAGPMTFTYLWESCDDPAGTCFLIEGAAGKIYTTGPRDVGRYVRSIVTAYNADGSASATSAMLGPFHK